MDNKKYRVYYNIAWREHWFCTDDRMEAIATWKEFKRKGYRITEVRHRDDATGKWVGGF